MDKLKPGTEGRHPLHGKVTVLDPNSAEVVTFKMEGEKDTSTEWTYVLVHNTRKVEGLIDHTIEDFDRRIARLERELEEARREKEEASYPKPGDQFLDPRENFTATVKFVEDGYVFYTFAETGGYTGANGETIRNFQLRYPTPKGKDQ